MIKKTLIIVLLLFFVHLLIVLFCNIPNWKSWQHQWQYNTIQAQRFLYQKSNCENIIVGSSLSTRLVMDSLVDLNITNLAMGGQSIRDGLNTLKVSQKLVKRIFIEINVALKEPNSEFTENVLDPFPYSLNKYVPSLQSEYQPISLLKGIISNYGQNKTKAKNKYPRKSTIEVVDSISLWKTLLVQQRNYNNEINLDFVNKSFSGLKSSINYFEGRGVKIIFFEMPIHETLCNSKFECKLRELFYLNFPKEHYSYINVPNCGEYNTSDGMHLLENSANKYTSHFKNQVNFFLKGKETYQ